MNAEQQYIEFYHAAAETIRSRSCAVLNAVRDDAFNQFLHMGFPTQKVEHYKYTDVSTAFAPNYGITLNPQLSTLNPRPSTYIYNIKDAPIDVTPYYHRVANPADAITALNTALVHEALLIHVPKGERAENPILVDHRLRGTAATMMNRRILVVMEKDSDATIIINDHAADRQHYLTTQVIEVYCHDGARLDLYEIEETTPLCNRFSNVYIHEDRDCTVKHNSLTLFNGQTRNHCEVRLHGEHSEVTLNGCAIGSGSQHIDNNTLIRHETSQCTSTELYKYVVDDQSVGAFAGKILVEKEAQKTTSQETNANLCASKEARMYTQPMLEIYADDVKCAHGSTVGVMDEAALFYMRQRGIPEPEARTLLKNAFMGQVIDQIKYEPLRQKLYVKVEKRFRGELDKCEDCRLCK